MSDPIKKSKRSSEYDSNPNRLKGESIENYKKRQEYNKFRIRQEQDKNPIKKAYNEMRDSQNQDENFITRNVRKIITSPAHLANYVHNKMNIDETNEFRSEDQYTKDNIEGVNSLLDTSSLLFPFSPKKNIIPSLMEKASINKVPSMVNQLLNYVGKESVFQEAQDKISEFSEKKLTNNFAMGGNLNNNNNNMTELNQFNEGGTHSQNPLGGIPVGGNNTVEQGETKSGNFVYSNRIKLTPEIIKHYNLPKTLNNKTVAEATKIIDSKFKDRTDKISESTKQGMLSKIAEAQEAMKPQEPTMNSGQNQMFLGGDTLEADLMPGMQSGLQGLTALASGDEQGAISGGLSATGSIGGTAIGGPIGGMIGGALGSTIGGLINSGSEKREAMQLAKKEHIINSSQFSNDFALGGPLDPYEFGDLINKYPNRNPKLGQTGLVSLNENDLLERNGYSNPELAPLASTTNMGINPNKSNILPKADLTKLGNTLGQAARYAPIAMNAYQLSQLKKPEYSKLNRLDQRFNPEYVDEQSLQNIANSELNNVNNSLVSATNGSVGALRSNMVATGLNRNKALSEAYMSAEAQNRQTNVQGQQFNAGINQANLNQDNLELDINDRNKAAYDNEKSKYLAEIGNGIGDIGKEETFKRIASTTTGYNWLGQYKAQNPKATAQEIEEASKKAGVLTDSKPNALGGYLFKNKRK